MDPSQNDSFGSFSNGQGGGGQPGFPPVPTGGFPGTGGAMALNNGGNKSRKWIWGVSGGLVVVVVGLLCVILINRKPSGGGGTANGEVAKEAFSKYKNLLITGTEDSGEFDTETWMFNRIVNIGAYSPEYSDYLSEVKKNYDSFWGAVDQNNMTYKTYNQYFLLYYYCANRDNIVAEFNGLGEKVIAERVDSLFGKVEWSGIFTILADSESNYFKNYSNDDADIYLAQAMDLIISTRAGFMKQTETIYNDLRGGDE